MPKISDQETVPSGTTETPAILMKDIRKTFKIKHTNSFKEAFLARLRRKKTTSDFNAIDGLDLIVPAGQSVAILGRNGSGKSTTLKMLSGVLRPDKGEIRTRGRVAGLLEVGAGFNPNLTGRDNVYLNAAILGMSKAETEARFNDILEFSEIGDFIDTEVKHYSSGMYARLGFSVAVHTHFDILLVDEILSVGDSAFRAKCDARMLQLREQGKTIFVVSHSANQVKKLCERGVVLQDGHIAFDGPIDEALRFMAPPKQATELPFEVAEPLSDYYQSRIKVFGNPTGPVRRLAAHGGGLVQEFQRGIITSHVSAEGTTLTQGISKGIFLTAYLRDGGPEGPWGYLVSPVRGDLEKLEARRMVFQNGEAVFTIDQGLNFIPN